MDADRQELLRLIAGLGERVAFCSTDSLGVVLPGLDVAGVGEVGLPVLPKVAQKLIAVAEQAPYGKGEQTIVDTDVRNVWQLSPSQFSLNNPQWDEFVRDVATAVAEDFGIEDEIQPSLYKLLIYRCGSFFKPHRDSEKVDGMFATLVVCLPSKHTGGELIVTHNGQTQTIDFAGEDAAYATQYAAFYADCQHEIRPVTSGCRICLVYNLTLAKRKSPLRAPVSDQAVSRMVKTLDKLFQDSSVLRIAVPFRHQYTQAGFDPLLLKGSDRTQLEVLDKSGSQLGLQVSVALCEFFQSGSPDPSTVGFDLWRPRRSSRYSRWNDDDDNNDMNADGAEFEEIFDAHIILRDWHRVDGEPLSMGQMHLDDSELLIDPDNSADYFKQSISEATGNEGATLERWYHNAVSRCGQSLGNSPCLPAKALSVQSPN